MAPREETLLLNQFRRQSLDLCEIFKSECLSYLRSIHFLKTSLHRALCLNVELVRLNELL